MESTLFDCCKRQALLITEDFRFIGGDFLFDSRSCKVFRVF